MASATLTLRAEGIGGEASVARAAEILRRGGTVAFPTETVYGLGANALDSEGIAKIFAAKQRPAWDPLIVHVEGEAMLRRVARVPEGAEGEAIAGLIRAFWPGPLTLLLPRTQELPDAVTAGRELVGVRQPVHPVARELIRLAEVPIAAPSANRFGHTSPTTAAHVLADLDGRIDAVLDGGNARVGLESTVFDPAARCIYRPGAVTAAQLEDVLQASVRIHPVDGELADTASRVSPGLDLRHYAPRALLVLVRDQAEMNAEIARHGKADVGVMLPDDWNSGEAAAIFRWGPWNDGDVLARLLFFGLRMLDSRGAKVIVCPVPQMDGIGEAIRDRLTKAARQ